MFRTTQHESSVHVCRASLAQHLDADTIIEITQQGLGFFTEKFESPYPWGKYDQVFVPEYNLGAMENPGCVTFTESYLFRGAATAAQYEGRATTILHEMAHMWFGDLVTMTWWDDLWLKESFADYMGTLATVEATEWGDAWVSFANRRKAWAYLQDQLPTTHPIVADILDLEGAKLNFDGITYAKGAAVLKQLVAYVGEEAFFEGARRYFRTYAFGNTTLDDLLTELSAASGRDLRAWSHAWFETSGVSTLSLQRDDNDHPVIVQSSPRPHTLSVGMYESNGAGEIVLRDRAELDISGERTPITVPDVPLVLLNDGDFTYAKVRLDKRSLTTVESSLDRVADPLARGLIWSALWNATRDGEICVSRYTAIVRAFAVAETNVGLLASVLGNTAFAIEHYLPLKDRTSQRELWLNTSWLALFNAAPGSNEQLTWARATAGAARVDGHRAVDIRAMLDATGLVPPGLAFDPDLRWMLQNALATTGNTTPEELNNELARDNTASGAIAHRQALASRPEAAAKKAAWEAALTDTTLTNDELDATISGFTAGNRRDLTALFDERYFALIGNVWSARSIEIAKRIVVGLFPSGDSLEPVTTWLTQNADAPHSLRRILVERRDHPERGLRLRSRSESPTQP